MEFINNVKLKEYDSSIDDYFKTTLDLSLKASKYYKKQESIRNENQKRLFDEKENQKIEFIKTNKTNDDVFNALSFDEKMELLSMVKNMLGFIYYPGCGDIYEISNYDEKFDMCHDVFELCKIEYFALKDKESENNGNEPFSIKIANMINQLRKDIMVLKRK